MSIAYEQLAPEALEQIVGGPERGTYHAAKHGVLGLTKSAALEYAARGIRINAVCPGLIDTAMSDQMKAAGQADALEAMLKEVPMGGWVVPRKSRRWCSGFAVLPPAWSSVKPSRWMAATPSAEGKKTNRVGSFPPQAERETDPNRWLE